MAIAGALRRRRLPTHGAEQSRAEPSNPQSAPHSTRLFTTINDDDDDSDGSALVGCVQSVLSSLAIQYLSVSVAVLSPVRRPADSLAGRPSGCPAAEQEPDKPVLLSLSCSHSLLFLLPLWLAIQ